MLNGLHSLIFDTFYLFSVCAGLHKHGAYEEVKGQLEEPSIFPSTIWVSGAKNSGCRVGGKYLYPLNLLATAL